MSSFLHDFNLPLSSFSLSVPFNSLKVNMSNTRGQIPFWSWKFVICGGFLYFVRHLSVFTVSFNFFVNVKHLIHPPVSFSFSRSLARSLPPSPSIDRKV